MSNDPHPELAQQRANALAQLAELDRRLSIQLDPILRHPEFLQLEGAWRGLHHLVRNSPQGEDLKILVMSISKCDLAGSLLRHAGDRWDKSPLFMKLYGECFWAFGGEPYGALVADYRFDHGQTDVVLLSQLAQVAAASHAMVLTSASPQLLGASSWSALNDLESPLAARMGASSHAAWLDLCQSEAARHLVLCQPRFRRRSVGGMRAGVPDADVADWYRPEGSPEWDQGGSAWSNSAHVLAAQVMRTHRSRGWYAAVCEADVFAPPISADRPAGVQGVPSADEPWQALETEALLSTSTADELLALGMAPLVLTRADRSPGFTRAPTLHRCRAPRAAAASSTDPTAQLSCMLMVNRIAHYIKCIVRDMNAAIAADRSSMARQLNAWIGTCVADADSPTEGEPGDSRPLRQASVEVEAVEGDPRSIRLRLAVTPVEPLEGQWLNLTITTLPIRME